MKSKRLHYLQIMNCMYIDGTGQACVVFHTHFEFIVYHVGMYEFAATNQRAQNSYTCRLFIRDFLETRVSGANHGANVSARRIREGYKIYCVCFQPIKFI